MEFVKSNCGSLLAQLAVLRFCCHAARTGYFRNARIWPACLIPMPSRARSPRYRRTAQPRSPSRRSGGKVGKLAQPSPTHVTACLRSIFRPSSRNRSTRSAAAYRSLALAPHAFRRRVRLLWRRGWQSRPLSPNNSFKPTQLRGGNVLRLGRSYLPPLRRSA